MQLYRIAPDNVSITGKTKWAPTQADAKRIAREIKGTATVIDVPAKKAELIDFLNEYATL